MWYNVTLNGTDELNKGSKEIISSTQRFGKVLLTRLGPWLTSRQIHFLNAIVNYLEVGRWAAEHGFSGFPRYRGRLELHTAVAASFAAKEVLYVEFGVFEGTSLRHWCGLLQNPQSMLHGFDSFQGLPEDWDSLRRTGTFSLGGRLPEFDDRRVVLHPGWFSDTLPAFSVPDHEQLVIHVDADLYSSTECVLRILEPRIVPGTIIIFDEFSDRLHELRAFEEYLVRTRQRFTVLGATSNLEQVAFQRTA